MKDRILCKLHELLVESEYTDIKDKTFHLGVFTEPCLTYMLDGKKTIESRFSKNKTVPYEKINKDDIVIIKKSGGNVLGYFTIKEILFFDLHETNIEDIKKKYNKELCVDESFWQIKKDSNYATLIFIDKLVKVEPFKIEKKGMQSWIKL